jgi:hypothetical protein
MDSAIDPKVQPKPRVTRRDVQLILDSAEKARTVPRNLLVAELGLGGLPALLSALEGSLTFDDRQEAEDGKFVVISGKWKDELLARLPKDSEKPDRLAEYIPDAVRVYFDPENLFPRRILYTKKHEKREIMMPMVSLDFVEVTLNGPVEDELFHYAPPDGVFPENITNFYLSRLVPQQTQAPVPAQSGQTPPQPGEAAQPGQPPAQDAPNPAETPTDTTTNKSP